MTLRASKDDLVQIQFPVFDVDGITPMTGLVDGDFTKTLILEAVASALVVMITEVGSSGRYVAAFTPNANGLWYVEIITPVDDVFADQVEVSPASDESVVAEKVVEIHQRLGLDANNPLSIKKTEHTADDWRLTHSTVGDTIIVQREDA